MKLEVSLPQNKRFIVDDLEYQIETNENSEIMENQWTSLESDTSVNRKKSWSDHRGTWRNMEITT